MARQVFLLSLLSLCLSPGLKPVLAQGCEITIGDQVYDFVQSQAGTLSRQLARSDYNARVVNFSLENLRDLQAHLKVINDRLGEVSQKSTESGSGASELSVALARAASSQQNIDELISILSELNAVAMLMDSMTHVPSLEEFRALGLHHVGRETFLESFYQLGDLRDACLATRYNIYFSITLDSGGNPIPSADQPGGVIDILGSAAFASGNPYLIAAYVVIKIGIAIGEGEQCKAKGEQQRQRIQDALQMLPSVLPSIEELYGLYLERQSERMKPFTEHVTKIATELTALQSRWRTLVSLNALRQEAAQQVLTSAKIEWLRTHYEKTASVQELFDRLALGKVLKQVADLNDYLDRKHIALLDSCGNVDGFLASEADIDALSYAREVFTVYRKQPSLAPIYDLLDAGLKNVSTAVEESKLLGARLPGRKCTATTVASHARFAAVRISSLRLAGRMLSSDFAMMSRDGRRTASPDGTLFCQVYVQPDGTHVCRDSAPRTDVPFQRFFNHKTGDPVRDILLGSGDGGYQEDNRRASQAIQEVEANLRARISGLDGSSAKVDAVVPDWLRQNNAVLDTLHRGTDQALQTDIAAKDRFSGENAGAVSSAKEAIDDFIGKPLQKTSTGKLLAKVGATDATLPDLPAASVPVDSPKMDGITAPDIAYGATNSVDKEIAQERRRLSRDVDGSGEGRGYRSLAEENLDAAAKFAAGGTGDGARVAENLLKDEASLRYMRSKGLKTASVTTVEPDGRFGRVPISDPRSLPSSSLLVHLRKFAADEAAFRVGASALHASLRGDMQYFKSRTDALSEAELVAVRARSVLDGGDISTGESLLKLGRTILDLATSFTPGISWGRSIYEAFTGRDLISGETLDTFAYGAAVVGAVTGGLGEEALGASKVVHSIEQICDAKVVQLAERFGNDVMWIAEGARTVGAKALDFSAHAGEKLRELKLSESEGERIVELSRPYYDSAPRIYEEYVGMLKRGEIASLPKEIEDMANHTGLVYIMNELKINPGAAHDRILAAAVNAKKELIATVYEVEKISSTRDIEAVKLLGKQRFYPLTK